MNPVVQMFMKQLQNKNPKGYQDVIEMMNSGKRPEDILKEKMGNISPERKQEILNQAKTYGCPNDILSRIQNMK